MAAVAVGLTAAPAVADDTIGAPRIGDPYTRSTATAASTSPTTTCG